MHHHCIAQNIAALFVLVGNNGAVPSIICCITHDDTVRVCSLCAHIVPGGISGCLVDCQEVNALPRSAVPFVATAALSVIPIVKRVAFLVERYNML